MHIPISKRFCIICTLFSTFVFINAQNTPDLQDAKTAIDLYNQTVANELEYINGREYKPYHHPTNDNPYLNSTSGIGSIFINGKAYAHKQLTYDIFKDQLIVIPDYSKFSNVYVQIKKSAIDSFVINYENIQYHLVNFKKQDCQPGLEPGFYEQLYDTKHTVLLIKHYVTRGVNNAITTFSYATDRFLFYNDRFYNVSSKRKLLALFKEDKKGIKRKIRSLNISYKKLNNSQLIRLIQYIDTL